MMKKDMQNLKAIILITDGPTGFYLHPVLFQSKGTGLISHHFLLNFLDNYIDSSSKFLSKYLWLPIPQ